MAVNYTIPWDDIIILFLWIPAWISNSYTFQDYMQWYWLWTDYYREIRNHVLHFFFLCVCTCVCVLAYTRVHWAGVYVHIHIHIVACACIYARVAEVALRCCSWGTIYLVFRDGLSFRLGWLTNEPKSHLTPPPKSMLSLECWRLNSSSHAIVSVLMPVIVWNKRGMIIIVFSFLCPML